MPTVNPREEIVRSLSNMVDFGRTYDRALPEELARWHCYILDGGHSLLVVLDDGSLGEAPSLETIREKLVPAPVKAVERAGWRLMGGFVVSALPYDPELGLVTEPEDDEFGDEPEEAGAATEQPWTKYSVGEPYPSGVKWRDGACEIRVTEQGVDLVLAISNPAAHEVKAFQKGNAEFALIPAQHHLMWAYKFTNPQDSNPRHGLAWSDQPWEYHRQAAITPAAAPAGRGGSFQFHLFLVDADTSIIKALRLISPPVEFADVLRDAVDAQSAVPYDSAAADREIQGVYARYQQSTDLVLMATARFEALRNDTVR